MRILVAVVVVGILGASLAGCTIAEHEQPVSMRPTPSASRTSPIAVPHRLPGEITRTLVDADVHEVQTAQVPRAAHRLYLHLRCSGPEGSEIRYALQRADGTRFGPSGTWTCDGTPAVIGEENASRVRGAVAISLTADREVRTAWAVLSTSAQDG